MLKASCGSCASHNAYITGGTTLPACAISTISADLHRQWCAWTTVALTATLTILFGVLEVGLLLVIGEVAPHGKALWVAALGITAGLLVIAGYMELPVVMYYFRGRIVGVSMKFIILDLLGAAFNLLAISE